MRIGPGFVRERAVTALAAGQIPGQENRNWSNADPDEVNFLETLYPPVVGRDLFPGELETWKRIIGRDRRTTIAWQFLTSPEYRHAHPAEQIPPDAVHWTARTLDGATTLFAVNSSDEAQQVTVRHAQLPGGELVLTVERLGLTVAELAL